MLKTFFNVIRSYVVHHPYLSDDLNRRFTTLFNKTSQAQINNRNIYIVLQEAITEYNDLIIIFCRGNKKELLKFELQIKQAKISLNRNSLFGCIEVKKTICTGILQVLN